MGWISARRENEHQEKILNVRDDVHAILGSGQMLDITLQRPFPEPFGDVDPVDVRKQIDKAIDSLYELLPAIRTIRRQWILELEYAMEVSKGSSTAVVPGIEHRNTSTSTEFSTSSTLIGSPRLGKSQLQYSSYLLDKVLDSANSYVRTLEESKVSNGDEEGDKIQAAYAAQIRKERERLEEWSQEVKRRDPNSWSPKKEQLAREILRGYALNLGKSLLYFS